MGKAPVPSRGVVHARSPGSSLRRIEEAMIRIRRSQARRVLGRRLSELGYEVDLGQLAVVDAVEAGPSPSGGEVTVGIVAQRLGVDPSRASRLVTATIRSGYVARMASQADGRRIHLELTDTGHDLIRAVHELRQSFYESLMSDWAPEERELFAQLLDRFTKSLTDSSSD